MFLEQQISILEWFLKIMWHWRLEKLCWKFSFDHRNKLQFNIYSHRKQLFEIVTIFHNFYCIFNQINAALVSRRGFLCESRTLESAEITVHCLKQWNKNEINFHLTWLEQWKVWSIEIPGKKNHLFTRKEKAWKEQKKKVNISSLLSKHFFFPLSVDALCLFVCFTTEWESLAAAGQSERCTEWF